MAGKMGVDAGGEASGTGEERGGARGQGPSGPSETTLGGRSAYRRMPFSAKLSVPRLRSLQERLRDDLRGSASVESATSHLVRLFADEFAGRVALARVFATVPFGRLPAFNRDAASAFAASKGVGHLVRPDTPVLSLLATQGRLPAWCDRRRSRGHVGIPLVSPGVVEAAPMVAALFAELGFSLGGGAEKGPGAPPESLLGGESARSMHVADARTAVDARGRKIIAAQDFVAAHGVETVFAVGGCWPNRDLVACIVFLQGPLDRATVGRLTPLMGVFRAGTTSQAMHGRYFTDGPP